MPKPLPTTTFVADLRTTALHGALGLLAGVLASALLQMTCGLYFLFEDQQSALLLITLTLSLPLGAACGGATRKALARAMFSGFGLALGCAAASGHFPASASWFCAAALLGGSLAGVAGRLALPAALGWCALLALPFCYERAGAVGLGEAAREAASSDAPWLGFAQHVLREDPLHMSFIYFNQLTGLSSAAAIEPLDASRLWLWALLVMLAALFRGWRQA